MTARDATVWTLHPELVPRLRELWPEGHSGAELARLLGHGLTKNAVIGKADRIGLSRPSPLKPRQVVRKGGRRHSGSHQLIGSTLPPLASET
jgi:hypothetical protein